MNAPASSNDSTAQHTPGPWLARRQRDPWGWPLGWVIERAEVACVSRATRGHPATERRDRIGWSSYANAATNEGDPPPYVQSGANARLIAAAPDLEEVVRDAMAWWHDVMDQCPRVTAPWALKANAALAKVEGREP